MNSNQMSNWTLCIEATKRDIQRHKRDIQYRLETGLMRPNEMFFFLLGLNAGYAEMRLTLSLNYDRSDELHKLLDEFEDWLDVFRDELIELQLNGHDKLLWGRKYE